MTWRGAQPQASESNLGSAFALLLVVIVVVEYGFERVGANMVGIVVKILPHERSSYDSCAPDTGGIDEEIKHACYLWVGEVLDDVGAVDDVVLLIMYYFKQVAVDDLTAKRGGYFSQLRVDFNASDVYVGIELLHFLYEAAFPATHFEEVERGICWERVNVIEHGDVFVVA